MPGPTRRLLLSAGAAVIAALVGYFVSMRAGIVVLIILLGIILLA